MRSTSNGSKSIAILLSWFLTVGGGVVPCVRADEGPERCLVLKIASRGIPLRVARDAMASFHGLLEEFLEVRWVFPERRMETTETTEDLETYPEPESVALGIIARQLDEAARRMEEMEIVEASRILDEAETRSRSVRFGEVIRPYLAEIFFRQGILFLWSGEVDRCLERFARSRALRPGFIPDPALHSPSVRDSWERSKERPAGPAELLVQSLPPGAVIHLDGRMVGVTPGRVQIPREGPVRIRVELEGYRVGEKTTQWLPGDSGMMEFTLEHDPVSGVFALLAEDPEGAQTGKVLAGMASRAGAARVAVLVYELPPGGRPVLRVISLSRGEQTASILGTVSWPDGERPAEQVAEETAHLLAKAGWPAKTAIRNHGRPWYHTWWFWTVVVTVAAGIAAAGAGGGGGSSGSSTGTIGVTF